MTIDEQVIKELQRIKGSYEKRVTLLCESKKNKGFDEACSNLIDAQLHDLTIDALIRIFCVLNCLKHAKSYED